MSTVTVPAADSSAWQDIYPQPPQLRLETVGPWCPISDTRLQVRLDDARPRVRPTGWDCPLCGAAWDITGTHGWWPTTGRRVPPARAAAMVAGCATTAAAIAMPLAGLDAQLVLAVAGVPATTAAGLVLHALAGRIGDWRRFRHNRLITVYGPDEHALADGEVRDGGQ